MSRAEMNITKERLRQQLMKRLDETGWRHQMRLKVQDLVHEKGTDKAMAQCTKMMLYSIGQLLVKFCSKSWVIPTITVPHN